MERRCRPVSPRARCHAASSPPAGSSRPARRQQDSARQGDRVTGVETPRGPLHAERVIVAAGAWTNALLASIEVRLPVVPLVAFRVVTEPLGVPATMPTIMIGEVPMYLREYDGALLWGMHYRADPRFRFVEEAVPERFDQLPLDGLAEAEARAATAFDVFPSLAASRSRTVAFGAPTFTPDQRPCLGSVGALEGLYVATGCNEAGVTHAPGYGRLLAELLTTGRPSCAPSTRSIPDRFGNDYPDGPSVVRACNARVRRSDRGGQRHRSTSARR